MTAAEYFDDSLGFEEKNLISLMRAFGGGAMAGCPPTPTAFASGSQPDPPLSTQR